MKIVIFGLSRSGTTALFYLLKNSLHRNTVCLFEPLRFDEKDIRRNKFKELLFGRRDENVLAKVLSFRPDYPADTDSFASFDKQVLIVRDPRDRLISRLLYGVHASNFCDQPDRAQSFISVLKRKEADPASISIMTLLETFATLNGEQFSFDAWASHYSRHSINRPLAFHDTNPQLFLFRYEDLIDGRLQELGDYIGASLGGTATVPQQLARVERTKDYGAWRDWFTKEDVAKLQPVLQPFLDRYYSGADWILKDRPAIRPEHGSSYVEGLINQRRALIKLPALRHD